MNVQFLRLFQADLKHMIKTKTPTKLATTARFTVATRVLYSLTLSTCMYQEQHKIDDRNAKK